MYKIKIKLSEEKLPKLKQKELYKKIDKIFDDKNISDFDCYLYALNMSQSERDLAIPL